MRRISKKELGKAVQSGKFKKRGSYLEPMTRAEAVAAADLNEVAQRFAHLSRFKGLTPGGEKSLKLMRERLESEAGKLENSIASSLREERRTGLKKEEEDQLLKEREELVMVREAMGEKGIPARFMSLKEIEDEARQRDKELRSAKINGMAPAEIKKIEGRLAELNREFIMKMKDSKRAPNEGESWF
jgi:hypothetical protein